MDYPGRRGIEMFIAKITVCTIFESKEIEAIVSFSKDEEVDNHE
jgi:hypothetical protein